MKRPTFVLMVLFAMSSTQTLPTPQGVSCMNDLIRNVSCTWKNFKGEACSIYGENKKKLKTHCKLNRTSPSGCILVFHNYIFSSYAILPNITFNCTDTSETVTIKDYHIKDHVKMNPPGTPNVNRTENQTLISWSPGHPRPHVVKFQYDVELQQTPDTGKVAVTLLRTFEQELTLEPWQLKGKCQVRVRVRPRANYIPNSTWSNWSPTESFKCSDSDITSNRTQVIIRAVLSSLLFMVIAAVILGFHRRWTGSLKMKPVPNPSKYFQTLHSVHRGNLKKWLNPQSIPASFFISEHHDNISPVEVARATSPSDSSSPIRISHSALSSQNNTFKTIGVKSLDSGISLGKESDDDDYGTKEKVVNSSSLTANAPLFFESHKQVLFHSSSTGEAQKLFDSMDRSTEISNVGLPINCPSYRSSSMPVESSNPGYCTLKDIQVTFRNNSL